MEFSMLDDVMGSFTFARAYSDNLQLVFFIYLQVFLYKYFSRQIIYIYIYIYIYFFFCLSAS